MSLFSEKLSLGGVKELLRAIQRVRGDLVLPTACVTTALYAASPSGEAQNSAVPESAQGAASSTPSTPSIGQGILTSKSELGHPPVRRRGSHRERGQTAGAFSLALNGIAGPWREVWLGLNSQILKPLCHLGCVLSSD